MFFLFAGSTELAKVPGLSSAGANPEVVPLTASADADIVQFGFSKVTDRFPLDPDGHPTPAIITRAAVIEADIPYCIVRAGTYIPLSPPYVDIGAEFGRDPRFGQAVPNAAEIYENSRVFAKSIGRDRSSVMIAETVPGGTTTALLILRALGFRDSVSSGGPENPLPLKEQIWRDTAKRLGISAGDIASDPIRILTEMGDPMQPAILGFISGLPENCDITLAGGTQMLAIAALLAKLDPSRRPLVATTRYVAEDTSSSFNALADKLGVKTWIAPLNFSKSAYKGLRDYELGFIKEGVGAGGSILYAERCGVSLARITDRVEKLYSAVEKNEGRRNV